MKLQDDILRFYKEKLDTGSVQHNKPWVQNMFEKEEDKKIKEHGLTRVARTARKALKK